jgi:hypothetical protein
MSYKLDVGYSGCYQVLEYPPPAGAMVSEKMLQRIP